MIAEIKLRVCTYCVLNYIIKIYKFVQISWNKVLHVGIYIVFQLKTDIKAGKPVCFLYMLPVWNLIWSTVNLICRVCTTLAYCLEYWKNWATTGFKFILFYIFIEDRTQFKPTWPKMAQCKTDIYCWVCIQSSSFNSLLEGD